MEKNKTIYFNMPDFVEGYSVYELFMKLFKECPYAFYPNQKIMSVFGIFPNCIWNGGSHDNPPVFFTYDRMKEVIDAYNDVMGLPVRFTFTNPCLEEKHFYDTYANLMVELAHNGKNEIIVSNNLEFENYLRKNYPNYRYIKSIKATEKEPCFIEDKYYMTVMRRAMNNNWTYLETIPEDKRDKIEFLCGDPCPDGCPRIYSHYKIHGMKQLGYGKDYLGIECSMEDIKGLFQNKYVTGLKTYISRESIWENYVPRGFINFKLSGRFDTGTIISNLVDYMVLPDYKTDVYTMLINAVVQYLREGMYGIIDRF